MTAKEKAEDLLKKYFYVRRVDYESAKACALICVDEILASSDHAGGWDDYWKEVRQEILTLPS